MSNWFVIAKATRGNSFFDYAIAAFPTKKEAREWVRSCESKQYDPYDLSPKAHERYKTSTLLSGAYDVDIVQNLI